MNLRITALIIGLLASLTAAAETLVVFGDDAYPPVIHMRDGKPAGILPAILDRAQSLTGDQYEVRLTPWKRAYESALRGQGGVIGVS